MWYRPGISQRSKSRIAETPAGERQERTGIVAENVGVPRRQLVEVLLHEFERQVSRLREALTGEQQGKTRPPSKSSFRAPPGIPPPARRGRGSPPWLPISAASPACPGYSEAR